MRAYKLIVLAMSVTIGASYCASAEAEQAEGAGGPDTPRAGHMIQKADKNGDGKVTFDELKAVAPQLAPERFKEMDHNGDGVLSKDDRIEGQGDSQGPGKAQRQGKAQGPRQGGNRLEALMKRADANHDGSVTYEELHAVIPKMTQERFNTLDKNHDGHLSQDDKPREGQAGNRGEGFRQADANHDGKVTYDELRAAKPNLTKERFDTLDSNHDGVLSPEDRRNPGKPGAGVKAAGATSAQGDEIGKLLEADGDHDGKVTFAGVSAAKPGFPKENFNRYDANGDGVLSAADNAAHQ